MLVCAFFAQSCTRDRGCSAHPAFPAPSVRRGRNERSKPRARHAARSRNCMPPSLHFAVIASQRIGAKRRPMTGSAKQSIAQQKERVDCFVASLLAMTILSSGIDVGMHTATLVMPGLDPGIHPSSQEVLSKRGIAGSSPAMTFTRRAHHSRVVPANAGTHAPRSFVRVCGPLSFYNKRRWLWVPARGRDDGRWRKDDER